jgi:hypothetical protein
MKPPKGRQVSIAGGVEFGKTVPLAVFAFDFPCNGL